MKTRRIIETAFLLLLIGTLTLTFNTRQVRAETITVPDDYPTIQQAISAATSGATIYVKNGTYLENLVVNRAVALIGENKENTIIDGSGNGTVIKVEADNVIIANLTIQNSGNQTLSSGIYVYKSAVTIKNVTIANNTIANNLFGIFLEKTSNNNICENHVTTNQAYGIRLLESSNNQVHNNNVTANDGGIRLLESSNNQIHNNTIANNSEGIWIYSMRGDKSSGNLIHGNIVENNMRGIYLSGSHNNTLTDNQMNENQYNFGVEGWTLTHFINNVTTTNTVNDKPIYYWINIQDETVPDDAGYVALINCTQIKVESLTLTNNTQGLLLAYTTNTRITGNTIENNWEGIRLWQYCDNNTIVGNIVDANKEYGIRLERSNYNMIEINNVTANQRFGIYLYTSNNNTIQKNNIAENGAVVGPVQGGMGFVRSNNNTIIHNNFIDNYVGRSQVFSDTSFNIWDDGYPSGGNYWSDYTGLDLRSGERKALAPQDGPGSDGIGDAVYEISADRKNVDMYPHMTPEYIEIALPGRGIDIVQYAIIGIVVIAIAGIVIYLKRIRKTD